MAGYARGCKCGCGCMNDDDGGGGGVGYRVDGWDHAHDLITGGGDSLLLLCRT